MRAIYTAKQRRLKREARRETISIILIILVFVTSIVLTCELESTGPAFLIAIAFLVFAACR